MQQEDLKSSLKKIAIKHGFDDIGFSKPEMPIDHQHSLKDFIKFNWHGDMAWMGNNSERRLRPTNLWPDAKSVIMLAKNYGPEENPLSDLERRSNGVISVYAKGKDYHTIIKKGLKNTAKWLTAETGAEVKFFVDTAPLMEKPLAMQAGLGWQGKHTNLVSRAFGSWTFLGAILTNYEFQPDLSATDHCGKCQKCLTICPTNAFPKPYQLNASKCISYLTIEHKGTIPNEFRKAIGNRIFGCDDCIAVCPWNKFAKTASEARFHPRAVSNNPPLDELLKLSEAEFIDRFKGSPIKRARHVGFIRNCLIAAGNSRDKSLLRSIEHHLSAPSPVIRGAAVWAFGELANEKAINIAWNELGQFEHQSEVIEEWQRIKKQ